MEGKKILRTKICDILGIEYPVLLAGMFWACGPSLVAAVSNAGGLGVLGATRLAPEQVRDWIRRTRSLTDKPFGVDLLLPALPESTSSITSEEDLKAYLPKEHVEFVGRLKRELGVPDVKAVEQATLGTGELRKVVEVILEEKVPVFASGLGAPDWVVADAHAQGIKVIGLAGNVRNALRQKEAGVDIIVAQGYEAGGHTGRIGTMALVPQIVDAVSPTPVLAAGGIGDGRGLVAALALGAVGIWVGTRFVATKEAGIEHAELGVFTDWTNENWKQKILQATEEDTRVSRIYTGKTARQINNKLIETWEKSGMSTLPMPLQGLLVRELQAGIMEARLGDYITGFGGQIAGMIKEIKSAKEVFDEIVEGAIRILEGLRGEVSIKG